MERVCEPCYVESKTPDRNSGDGNRHSDGVGMYVCIRSVAMYVCVYVCMYGVYVCMYVCMYGMCVYVCMHVCICVCVYTCACDCDVCPDIYIYI